MIEEDDNEMVIFEYNIESNCFHFNYSPEKQVPNSYNWRTIGVFYNWDFLLEESNKWHDMSIKKRKKVLSYLWETESIVDKIDQN